jgi:tyrosine-protein kinase Etk/Wzc
MDSIHNETVIKNNLTIVDFIKAFLRYKKIIIIVSLIIGIILSILMFFVFPPIFKSTGVVKITSKSSGLNSMISSGSIPGLGDVGDLAGSSSSSKELALYESILNSRRCLEETIIKFKLNDEWEFKYMEIAIKHFQTEILSISKDKTAGILTISVFDKDKNRSKDICDFLIFQLNKINTEMNAQNAKNNREFIEMRYNVIKNDLKIAEDSLKIYQEIHGVAPDLQVKAAAQSEFALETELKSEEIKLELLNKILSPDQAELKIQQDKINAIKKQILKMKESNDNSLFLNLKGSPEILMSYLRLVRNVEIQTKLLTYILPIFEQAKIEEKRDTPSVIVLDQPYIPEVKTKPKRIISILIGMILALFFTYFAILIYEYFIKNLFRKLKETN